MAHRHKDSRAKWTTTDDDPAVAALAGRVSVLEAAVKAILAAGGSGGGTTPVPNPDPPPPPPDVTAPTISGVTIAVTGQTTARITLTTSEPATVRVRYGTSPTYGSATGYTAMGTSHSIDLTGLTAGTTYHVLIEAVDASNNVRQDSGRFFTTQAVVVPPPGNSVTVASISALKTALANNAITEIVVVDGTYIVSTAASQASNSLWIGSAFASRTNPVLVRAQTIGGVTFDGNGATYFGGLSFEEGAHHQTWRGFKFANGTATSTGVIVFGGYSGKAGAHHITLEDITIMGTCRSSAAPGTSHDHAVYFSNSVGGVHDIVIDRLTVDGSPSNSVDSALHFFHSGSGEVNAWNVTVRDLSVNGTDQPIILWDSTLHDILIEDATIANARNVGVRVEQSNSSSDITLRRVTTTNSMGGPGFYSSAGPTPAGVTFDDCSFDA